MSFNRLNYDACTYVHNLRQSIGSADYQLGTPIPHCQPCFANDPSLRLGVGNAGATCKNKPLVDVDSELHGITRPATNCPTQKFIPNAPYCELTPVKDCRDAMPAEDTRLSNPSCTLRGTGWNRWEWLCQNPQDKVFVPFDYNVNNRLVVKDNHRPCIPDPLDQSLALPPSVMSDQMVSYKMEDCGKIANNVPSVHWQSCDNIKNY